MVAEDIGLLPRNCFTSLLYDGARSGTVETRLRALFEQMNARDLPAPRVVPYFNGGLFTDVVTVPLGSEQIVALTKASEANWTYVAPHIFGHARPTADLAKLKVLQLSMQVGEDIGTMLPIPIPLGILSLE